MWISQLKKQLEAGEMTQQVRVLVQAWGSGCGFYRKSLIQSPMSLSSSTVVGRDRRILGLAGLQRRSRFSERLCLKEIRWRVTEQNICPPLASVHVRGYTHLYTYANGGEGESPLYCRTLHKKSRLWLTVSPANWFCTDYSTHSLVISGKPGLHEETVASSRKPRLRQFLWVCVQAFEPQLWSDLMSWRAV